MTYSYSGYGWIENLLKDAERTKFSISGGGKNPTIETWLDLPPFLRWNGPE